jgi:hypothetical protein
LVWQQIAKSTIGRTTKSIGVQKRLNKIEPRETMLVGYLHGQVKSLKETEKRLTTKDPLALEVLIPEEIFK